MCSAMWLTFTSLISLSGAETFQCSEPGHTVEPSRSGACGSEDIQALLQHQTYANVDRTMTSDLEWQALVSRADCGPAIPWPCGNEEISRFPLQQINTGNNCANGMATISSLDLNTSQYTDLCYIPGVCLNACGINPIDSAIYCHTRGNSFEEQFVRVDCPVSDLQSPVQGSLCYFGPGGDSFAGAFDPKTGNYIFRQNRNLRSIDSAAIAGFLGSTTPSSNSQVRSSITGVASNFRGNVADFIIRTTDIGDGNQTYLIGCHQNMVYFHSLDNPTNPTQHSQVRSLQLLIE
ncbi:unnamed protein product [Durusdinium trenchii]|uniref:Uncharacterized protein n=1 Tax=Durusdinium trenchii TaxID=1381693 RepID=A0ABP0JYD4_9DINO